MEFVYVVVSEKDDFYVEYCAVSVYSLKKYNKEAKVCVICDSNTYDHIIAKKKYFLEIVDKIISVSINQDYTALQKSRFLKTSVRTLIDGDFVFIDTDTIITGDLKGLHSFDKDIGAVKTQDSDLWSKDNQHIHFKRYNTQRNLPEDFNYGIDNYFNSGVIICRDTPKAREFYEEWHKSWLESSEKYSFHQDQCDFARINALYGNLVTEITGDYNFMAIYPGISMKFFNDCKIFHYFSTSDKLKKIKIKGSGLLERLSRNGISSEIDDLIADIKTDYLKNIFKEREDFIVFRPKNDNKIAAKLSLYLKYKIFWYNIYRKLKQRQIAMSLFGKTGIAVFRCLI